MRHATRLPIHSDVSKPSRYDRHDAVLIGVSVTLATASLYGLIILWGIDRALGL
ncbi:hypothetical protein [uncultured Paraglaciecola sp.]|uniref:hypothetical protein n=1 Tax=uncultured Paraglaciecola sp. TaxID=1765024 RepID=UPI00260CDAA1|nr:hypothetical protein [uncultured Paraglaciecola sp.]